MNIDAFIEPVKKAIEHLPRALEVLVIGYIIIKIATFIFVKALKIARVPKSLINILESLTTVVLWVFTVAAVFHSLGLSQLAFAISGSLAIIGLGLANGANLLVGDIIAGLFLAKDNSFNIGEKIKIGDIEGVIEKVDIRKVRVRTEKDELAVIPNSTFDKTNWIVLNKNNKGGK